MQRNGSEIQMDFTLWSVVTNFKCPPLVKINWCKILFDIRKTTKLLFTQAIMQNIVFKVSEGLLKMTIAPYKCEKMGSENV